MIAAVPCPLCSLAGPHRLAALALSCPMCLGRGWIKALRPDRGPVGRFPAYRRRSS